MGTVFRPLLQELPGIPEAGYKWTDIVIFVVWVFIAIWICSQQAPLSLWIAGYFLTMVIPDFLCRKFQGRQKPQKSVGSIIKSNEWLTAICWIVAFGTIAVAILAGLGVPALRDILGAWPDTVFQSIPILWVSLFWIVFCPVFRVAAFIEKRVWLRWVWASVASAIGLAILCFQHRIT